MNCSCCGATIMLTIRKTESLVTFSGVVPEVAMITFLFRRMYLGLMKGDQSFFFLSLVTVINSPYLGADAAAPAYFFFVLTGGGGGNVFAFAAVVVVGHRVDIGRASSLGKCFELGGHFMNGCSCVGEFTGESGHFVSQAGGDREGDSFGHLLHRFPISFFLLLFLSFLAWFGCTWA